MNRGSFLPPYTLGERIREVRMRLKAFSWRVRYKFKKKLAPCVREWKKPCHR
jgi:hypothetical protein